MARKDHTNVKEIGKSRETRGMAGKEEKEETREKKKRTKQVRNKNEIKNIHISMAIQR
jgi:hypothetical protein